MSRAYTLKGVSTLQGELKVDPMFYNFTATVKYYSDAFITEVTPTAGSVTISGTIVGGAIPISFSSSPVDSTDPTAYASAGSPLELVTIIPIGVTGASHYKVTITGTEG